MVKWAPEPWKPEPFGRWTASVNLKKELCSWQTKSCNFALHWIELCSSNVLISLLRTCWVHKAQVKFYDLCVFWSSKNIADTLFDLFSKPASQRLKEIQNLKTEPIRCRLAFHFEFPQAISCGPMLCITCSTSYFSLPSARLAPRHISFNVLAVLSWRRIIVRPWIAIE